MKHIPADNWRNDPGLICEIDYKKKFAILPVTCHDGVKVWLSYYYTLYYHWGYRNIEDSYYHTDQLDNITEAEYIIRKLTEGF